MKKNLSIVLIIFLSGCISTFTLKDFESESIKVDNSIDSTIYKIILPYQAKIDFQMDKVLCYTKNELIKGRPEGNLGNLICDLSLETSKQKADICIMNNGGLRSTILKGQITERDIFKVMPFENELVVLNLHKDEFISFEKDIRSLVFGIDSFNSTPILPTLNMPSHSFTLHTENAKTFLAQSTEAELLAGYVPATDENGYAYNLMAIQQNYCPDIGADEVCSAGPFSQFTIRGNEGLGDTGRWNWGANGNSLILHDFDNSSSNSGAVEIDITDGYMVKLQIELTDSKQGKEFKDDHWGGWGSNDSTGVFNKTELATTVLMKGGDKLSIDIDSDWGGTTDFYLKVQGKDLVNSHPAIVNDDVTIPLLGVWKEGTDGGGGNGGGNEGGGGNDGGDTSDSGGMGMGTIALISAGIVGGFLLLK